MLKINMMGTIHSVYVWMGSMPFGFEMHPADQNDPYRSDVDWEALPASIRSDLQRALAEDTKQKTLSQASQSYSWCVLFVNSLGLNLSIKDEALLASSHSITKDGTVQFGIARVGLTAGSCPDVDQRNLGGATPLGFVSLSSCRTSRATAGKR